MTRQILTLEKRLKQQHTYKQITQTIKKNILNWMNNEPQTQQQLPPSPKSYEVLLHQAEQEQNKIGWNNFLKGWMSKKWAEAQQEYYKARNQYDETINNKYHNGLTWSKKVIQIIQQIAFETWKFRNKDIYGHSKEEEQEIQKIIMKRKVRRESAFFL